MELICPSGKPIPGERGRCVVSKSCGGLRYADPPSRDFSVTSISNRDRPPSPAGLLHAKAWQVAMIGLGTAAVQLDTSVNIAFPAITRGFGLSIGDIQWVVICYVLT